VFMDYLD
jgi:hypothetical protein